MTTSVRFLFLVARPACVAFLLVMAPLRLSAAQPAADARAEELWRAARSGNATAVAKLLDAGVDVNARFRYDATALSYACDHGHLEVVKVLLERGANVNVKDSFYGATPLRWAVDPAQERTPAHDEIVRLLVARGATDLEAAAFSAAGGGYVAALSALVERIPSSPALMTDLLDWAVQQEQPAAAEWLRGKGATPAPGDGVPLPADTLSRFAGQYRGDQGRTLTIALADGHPQLVRSGQPATPLIVLGPHTMRPKGMAAIRLVFEAAVSGPATALILSEFGATSRLVRTGDPQ